jgi:translation initiation factor 1
MSRKKNNKKTVSSSETGRLTSNPFASLAPDTPTPVADDVEPPPPSADLPTRAIVRYERKGRGGKEVSVLELRGVPAAALESWLSELKAQLGCGGFVEEGHLVLAGDQRQRLAELLEKKGVAKITVS